MKIDPQMSDVLLAARFLKGRIRHTPTERSEPLSRLSGGEIFLKWENHQICGSFKIRGALNKMFSLSLEERGKGVVTASSGNHAQGIAMAARSLGVRAVICVPGVCPQTKRDAILMLGGESVELRVVGHLYDDAEDEAHRLQKEEGMTYVSSYEDHFIVSGAGTLGLELIMDEPEIDMVISPAGGGGLLNGVAIPVKTARPEAEIWGVQSVASNPYVVSWPGGKVLDVEYKDSLADGLTGSIPQSLLDLAKKRVTGFVEVQESDIAQAIGFLHSKHHQVVEGAGAVGVAAILAGKIPVKGKRVGVVISGGNIDDGRLLQILNDYRE
ncbi:MAG TPA: threonine/serine dehydratase [Synergistales bacterium]|jgi:threonine dehydratase|nr:threonine/serine dehydratase [Synergistales bacterium]HRV71788.1 threonine/serine dehydratase [Thermovirgaceae bacterium]